jgi:hypothetical protein
LALLLPAQESRSTITGHVKDAQGAVIANAKVVVTNTDRNASVNIASNDVGYFEAALLMPGNYSVTAEAPGFKKTIRTGITLEAADRRDVEMLLEVGALTDSISVTAEPPLVDVGRTDSGRVLDERSVRDLPVMANTVLMMVQYTAGVQNGGPPIVLGPHSTQGGSDYNNGGGVGGNTWTIDGAVNDGNGRYTANLPNVNAVAETKVLTTTFDGSFGHSTGLGIVVMTKSGNNQFHGTAAETYWNQRWQGASFFAKQNYFKNIASLNAKGDTAGAAAAAAKPIQAAGHSNLWDLTVTGPIWIPKIFDGRNKMFFTFSYGGEKDSKPEESSTYNRVVPTVDNKKGDFSDLLKVSTNPATYQLYDPFSTVADTARSGHYKRVPIPGNILPGNYMAIGQKVYDKYKRIWPDPNNWFDKTVAPTTNPFLSVNAPYNWKFDQYSGRMDVNVGNKHRFFGRYSQNHFVEMRGDWTIDIEPGLNNTNAGGTGVTRDDQNGVLDWVYTITPSTMFHASTSISNWDSMSSVADTPFKYKPSDMGLPAYLDAKCGNWCYMPQMNITGYATNGIGGYPAPVYNRFWAVNADLYHNRGNHSFRAGLDFRQQVRSAHAGNNDGQYTFNNSYFKQCDDNCGTGYSAANIGLGWAAFMMGLPSSIGISNSDSNIVGDPYYSWFVQDTWRVTPKLTLTLSLRNEFEQGATERYNRGISTYDQNAVLPISSAVEAAYAANPQAQLAASQFKVLGGSIYMGTPGAPSRAWDSALMWLPRIGFGYQVNRKTVLRGGYGIYYDTSNVNAISYSPDQTGYSRGTNPVITTTDSKGVPVWNTAWNVAGGVSPLTDPFPIRSDGTRYDAPFGNALGLMAKVGSGWTYTSAANHPRQQRWRAGVERQLAEHDVIEASYEGTYTSSMNINTSLSAIPSTYYNFSNVRSDTNPTLLSANVTNPYYGINSAQAVPSDAKAIYGSNVTGNATLWQWMSTQSMFTSSTRGRASLIVPYSNGNINIPRPWGKARSQMFEVNYNHRWSRGLTTNVAYTAMIQKQATGYMQGWSGEDASLPQSPWWTRGGASPHRVVATWVYDLPFGKGRQFVQNALLSQIIGGWTLAGTYQFQPGGLIGWGNIFYYGDVNNIKIDNPTPDRWFNNSGCVNTTAVAPGDSVVGTGACTSGFEKRSTNTPNSYQYRTMPNNVDGLRTAGFHNWNASLMRDIKIREKLTFQARLDAMNFLNHSVLNGVDTSSTSSTFGKVTSASASPNRFLQIKGQLRW